MIEAFARLIEEAINGDRIITPGCDQTCHIGHSAQDLRRVQGTVHTEFDRNVHIINSADLSEKQRVQLAGLLEAYSPGQATTGDSFLNIGKLRAMLSGAQTDFLTVKDGGHFIALQVGTGEGYLHVL